MEEDEGDMRGGDRRGCRRRGHTVAAFLEFHFQEILKHAFFMNNTGIPVSGSCFFCLRHCSYIVYIASFELQNHVCLIFERKSMSIRCHSHDVITKTMCVTSSQTGRQEPCATRHTFIQRSDTLHTRPHGTMTT